LPSLLYLSFRAPFETCVPFLYSVCFLCSRHCILLCLYLHGDVLTLAVAARGLPVDPGRAVLLIQTPTPRFGADITPPVRLLDVAGGACHTAAPYAPVAHPRTRTHTLFYALLTPQPSFWFLCGEPLFGWRRFPSPGRNDLLGYRRRVVLRAPYRLLLGVVKGATASGGARKHFLAAAPPCTRACRCLSTPSPSFRDCCNHRSVSPRIGRSFGRGVTGVVVPPADVMAGTIDMVEQCRTPSSCGPHGYPMNNTIWNWLFGWDI